MQKTNILRKPVILVLFIILFSCEKQLEYTDLDYKPQLVLNGLIYQDSIIRINVTRTKSILEADSVLPFIENVDVKLYENDVFVENLIFDSLGQYRSTIKTKANTNYKIEASTVEIDKAVARFAFEDVPNFSLKNIVYSIRDTTVHIDEPQPTDTNLYYVSIQFDMLFTDNAEKENYYDFDSYGKFTHLSIWRHNTDSGNYETVSLWQSNISYITFRDYKDNQKYYSGNSGSYNGYERNRYISDQQFNGKEMDFKLRNNFSTTRVDSVEILLFSYPYDYVHFHETGYRYINLIDNSFAQPMNIYSNIENGLGIVCAVSCSKQKIYLVY